jgi:hypothetical protein
VNVADAAVGPYFIMLGGDVATAEPLENFTGALVIRADEADDATIAVKLSPLLGHFITALQGGLRRRDTVDSLFRGVQGIFIFWGKSRRGDFENSRFALNTPKKGMEDKSLGCSQGLNKPLKSSYPRGDRQNRFPMGGAESEELNDG